MVDSQCKSKEVWMVRERKPGRAKAARTGDPFIKLLGQPTAGQSDFGMPSASKDVGSRAAARFAGVGDKKSGYRPFQR